MTERRTALAAVGLAALIAVGLASAGVGLGSALGVGAAGYAAAVWAAVARWQLRPGQVLRATSRGAVVAAVLAALALVGVAKSVVIVTGVAS